MPPTLALLLQVLPLAIGAAMSPTFLAMQIVVLSSGPGSTRKGWALAGGSMSMLLLLSVTGVGLLNQLPKVGQGMPSTTEGVIFLLAGLALLALAWHEHTAPSNPNDHPALRKIADADLPVVFAIGAGRLLTNATTLALYIPAIHLIVNSSAWVGGKVLVFLVLFLLTEAAVLAPVVAVSWKGDEVRPLLSRIHDLIGQYSHTALMVVCILFGVGLIGFGVRAFFA